MFAVKHRPFDMIPQVPQRGEDGRKCASLVMAQNSGNIFKQQIPWPFGFSQSGNFKEQSASGVGKSFPSASIRKCLAGESPAQQVELGQVVWVNGSCIWIISFLLSDVVDGTVAGFSILVDLAVANALEPAHTGQSSPKTAHPGKHIKITDQVISSPS